MVSKPFRSNDLLDKAAHELGNITIEWARIEGAIDELIVLLGPLEEGPAGHVFTGNIDIRNKIQMLKGLAFLRQHDRDWFGDVLFLLEYIDNDLRPKRNGLIHAEWFIPSGKLLRRTRKTKILRPQAHQLVLETEQNVSVKLRELRALLIDLQQVWLALLPALWYMIGEDDQLRPNASPSISYKQYLRWGGFGNPARQIRQKQQRRRKAAHKSKRPQAAMT